MRRLGGSGPLTMLIDPFGRRVDYLRVSVTDRCDLRCFYCLPKGFNRLAACFPLLADDAVESGPARYLRLRDSGQRIGLITPMSSPSKVLTP